MIAIVDYGVGNLFSLASSLKFIGVESVVTSDPETIRNSDQIILPGVGAFGDAANKLRETGLDEIVREQALSGKPLMGICLGMQLLFEKGYEYGEHEGLGLLKGNVVPMEGYISQDLDIPHMGWNSLDICVGNSEKVAKGAPEGFAKEKSLLRNINDGDCVYFVHSYFATDCDDSVIATAEYGEKLTAAVQKENIMGCQFHPEKSGKVGLAILEAFSQEVQR